MEVSQSPFNIVEYFTEQGLNVLTSKRPKMTLTTNKWREMFSQKSQNNVVPRAFAFEIVLSDFPKFKGESPGNEVDHRRRHNVVRTRKWHTRR